MSRFIELLDKIEAILLLPISQKILLLHEIPSHGGWHNGCWHGGGLGFAFLGAFVEDKALLCLMTQRTHVGAALKASNRHANVLDCLG
jgi:hypothetical protein